MRPTYKPSALIGVVPNGRKDVVPKLPDHSLMCPHFQPGRELLRLIMIAPAILILSVGIVVAAYFLGPSD